MGGAELLPTLVVAVGLAVAGVILMVRSRHGHHDFPACGRCRYDATGSIGEATRCPECGAEYAEVGIRPPRRSRQGLMTAGAGLTVCAFVLLLGMVMVAALAARAQAARAEAMAARAQAVAALRQALQAQQQAATEAANAAIESDGEDAGR